jgi:hypothetical protein
VRSAQAYRLPGKSSCGPPIGPARPGNTPMVVAVGIFYGLYSHDK